jgi:hydrogenase maturation protease
VTGRDRVWYVLLSSPPDTVVVDGRVVSRGSRVRLKPTGRGDLLDSVLAGMMGVVECIEQDDQGKLHLAVAIVDDPARDLGAGRHPAHRFFFTPAEVEPIDDSHELPTRRLLIAGIGNLFLGDDGFGVEVVRRLADRVLPPGVELADFGIRGMDLAYALGGGWDGVILVDALRHGEPPGSLVLIEPEVPEEPPPPVAGHAMDPVAVLALATRLGTVPPHAVVLGCEPGRVPDLDGGDDIETELSAPVDAAVDAAVERIVELAGAFLEHGSFTPARVAGGGA